MDLKNLKITLNVKKFIDEDTILKKTNFKINTYYVILDRLIPKLEKIKSLTYLHLDLFNAGKKYPYVYIFITYSTYFFFTC